MKGDGEFAAPGAAPHKLCHSVFPPEERADLLDWTLSHQSDFTPAKIFGRGVRVMGRNNLVCAAEVFRPWNARLRPRFAALMAGLADELGILDFSADYLELQLTSYADGAFYKRHIDTVTGKQALDSGKGVRVLSAVYYFHRQPRGFTGGALRLFPIRPENDAHFVDVSPEDNAIIAFPSWVRHEVLPVHCPSGDFADTRFAINCWAHKFFRPSPENG